MTHRQDMFTTLMERGELAAVMAEHEPDDRCDDEAWCMKCADATPWPCLFYRLAKAASDLADKVARAEVALNIADTCVFSQEAYTVINEVRAALAGQPEQVRP